MVTRPYAEYSAGRKNTATQPRPMYEPVTSQRGALVQATRTMRPTSAIDQTRPRITQRSVAEGSAAANGV